VKLIRLYYAHFQYKKNQLTDEIRNEILKLCEKVINQHGEIYEATTAESLIHGLSLTKEWKSSLKYLEQVKSIDKAPSESTYCCIISRAIDENDNDLAWKLLDEMAEGDMIPKSFIFIQWIEKYRNDCAKMEQMFEYIANNHFILPEIDIQVVADELKHNYSPSLVTINKSGKCPSCTNKLPGVKLQLSEFEKLANRFLEDILIRQDIYMRTNPDEIKRFQDFVKKTVPYDSVIDGLNVAYSQGDKLTPKVYAKTLKQVVKHFADKQQKCLVIGKKHMKNWPRNDMAFIRENSHLFLTEDV
jgi:ribonuclease P protein 3